MTSQLELVDSLGDCIRELGEIRETLCVLYNSDVIDESTLQLLVDSGISLDSESPSLKKARQVLRSSSIIPRNSAVICTRCDIALDILGDETVRVIDDFVWMEKGCPYCKNQSLELILDAKDTHGNEDLYRKSSAA